MLTKAPRNGIMTGSVTGMPMIRATTTWPLSWTRIKSTMPTPNAQPKSCA